MYRLALKPNTTATSWVGRYHADKSELLTVNINPSMAFKFNDNVSIGFGVSALYADGELTNAADVGLGNFARREWTPLGFQALSAPAI